MSKKSKKDKKKKSKKDSKYKSKEKQKASDSKETSNSDLEKHHHKKKKKHSKEHKDEMKHKIDNNAEVEGEEMNVPLTLMEKPSNAMTPMTKEQWEKQQSTIRRVYDETTGRHRLIKGDGEVIEEIVSRERHLAINKMATKGDQEYFQSKVLSNLK